MPRNRTDNPNPDDGLLTPPSGEIVKSEAAASSNASETGTARPTSSRGRGQNVTLTQMEAYSGPLPSPETLNGYEKVLPGLAERIVSMAEKNMEHRHELETKAVNDGILSRKQGLLAGVIVVLAGFGLSGGMTYMGHAVEAASVAGTSLVALAGVFVYGTRSRKEERQEKAKDNPELPSREPKK